MARFLTATSVRARSSKSPWPQCARGPRAASSTGRRSDRPRRPGDNDAPASHDVIGFVHLQSAVSEPLLFQGLLLVAIVALFAALDATTRSRISPANRITSGYRLSRSRSPGFRYQPDADLLFQRSTSTFARAFWGGLLNTRCWSRCSGIFFATVLAADFIVRHRPALQQLAGGRSCQRLCRSHPQRSAAAATAVHL